MQIAAPSCLVQGEAGAARADDGAADFPGAGTAAGQSSTEVRELWAQALVALAAL